MRKLFLYLKIFLLFIISVFFAVSCNNLVDYAERDSNYADVYFSIYDSESSARTIVPTTADKRNLYFTLEGESEGVKRDILITTDKKKVEKMPYSELLDSGFRLTVGNWNFYLTGYKKENDNSYTELISGDALNTSITPGDTNSITFEMTPVATGKGSINISLLFDLGSDTQSEVTKIDVVRSLIDGSSPKEYSWPKQPADSCIDVSKLLQGIIEYNESEVDCGTYLLTFTVTVKNTATTTEETIATQVGYRSDIVIVSPGSESAAENLPLKLNQAYKITYDLNGGNWVSGSEPPAGKNYYTSYEKVELPMSDTLSKADASFAGWYIGNVPATETTIGQKGSVTYKAKWQDKALFVSASGDDTNGNGTLEYPYKTVLKALQAINASADNSLDWTINIINGIEENVSISDDTISTAKAHSVTIEGHTGSSTDSIKWKDAKSTISVSSSVPVTISKLKIIGSSGTKIETEIYGGGVYVQLGSVILDGGTITENGQSTTTLGGGVYVASSGTFTLNSGTISLNGSTGTTTGGGGIYNAGTFNVNGGSISANNAQNGGGIYIAAGQVGMSGGTISGHTVTGNGGGVYIQSGTYVLTAGNIGAESAQNNASNGGGLYIAGGTSSMSGGNITYNTAGAATNGNGGGVYVDSAGKFYMSDGIITANIAGYVLEDDEDPATCTSCGGGIYNLGTLQISGTATIGGEVSTPTRTTYANYSNQKGGGIFNDSQNFTFGGSNYSVKGNYTEESGGGVYTKVDVTNHDNVDGNGCTNGRLKNYKYDPTP